MTNRTRYFLVGSGLIVAVGLGTGLVAYYNGGLAGRRSMARLSELSYISSDVTALAYADVRHIMDSEFRQRLRAVMPTGQEKDRLLAETGIDIERDIDSVLTGLNPSSLPSAPPTVLLRGRFNDSQIESVAVQHGATVETYQGRKILIAPASWRSDHQTGTGEVDTRRGGIAFLEPGLVGLGSIDALKRAIDAAANQDTAAKNADLMKFVQGVVDTGDAWIAGRFDGVANNPMVPSQMRDQLASVQWFAISANIDNALTCRLRAETRDSEAGEQLRAIVNGALAMAKMMAGKDARFSGVLDSVQATGSGEQMEVSFTVPPEMLDAITSASGAPKPIPQ